MLIRELVGKVIELELLGDISVDVAGRVRYIEGKTGDRVWVGKMCLSPDQPVVQGGQNAWRVYLSEVVGR